MYLRHPGMSRGDDYTFWKDILEVPAVLVMLILLGLSFWNIIFMQTFILVLAGLLLLEIYYGLRTVKNGMLGFFWAYVMVLRAVARSLGFVTGATRFLPEKAFSK